MPERQGAAQQPRRSGGDGAPGKAARVPGREDLDALHVRMLARDPTAPAELAGLIVSGPLSGPFLRGLRLRAGTLLRSMGSTVRDDALHDAAVTAYMSYAKHPEQYDPSKGRGGLLQFLVMSAHRDLLNARPGIKRHGGVEPLSLVELRAERRNTQVTLVGVGDAGQEANPEEMLETRERAAELRAQLAAQETLMETEAERKVLRYMAAGERDTILFADVLGIGGQPPDVQQREVKRVKDKIKKRLERAGLRARRGTPHG